MKTNTRKYKYVVAQFLRDNSGATAIEYGLLAAILAVGIITGAQGIGSSITSLWNGVSNDVGAT